MPVIVPVMSVMPVGRSDVGDDDCGCDAGGSRHGGRDGRGRRGPWRTPQMAQAASANSSAAIMIFIVIPFGIA